MSTPLPPVQSPAPGQQIPSHLVWAILTTLFCCLPFGIVSIVFAAQVNSKLAAGDVAGAQESSDKAKKWAIWAAIAGVIVIILYTIFLTMMGGMAALQQNA